MGLESAGATLISEVVEVSGDYVSSENETSRERCPAGPTGVSGLSDSCSSCLLAFSARRGRVGRGGARATTGLIRGTNTFS